MAALQANQLPWFFFSITCLPNGNFRVECRAQSDHATTSIEHLDKECETEVEARDRAYDQAGARGFRAIVEEEP